MGSAAHFVAFIALAGASGLMAQPKPGRGSEAPKGFAGGGPKAPPAERRAVRDQAIQRAGPRLRPPSPVERLLGMSPEQRDRVLEKLPPGQQANLRKRFERFDQLPAAEKARRLEQWKRFDALPPEKRELLTRQMQAFSALPGDRRVALGRALGPLSRMTPEERQQRLNSKGFRNRFSESERQMLSDLAENYPMPRK